MFDYDRDALSYTLIASMVNQRIDKYKNIRINA